jgi:hypothetical protein
MEELNQNIELALEKLDFPETDKKVIRKILYAERLKKEKNWDNDAPDTIQNILHNNAGEEE